MQRLQQEQQGRANADAQTGGLPSDRFPEQRYHVLADAMPQMVWATDANGAPFYYNRRWYEYTGLSEQESLGFGFIKALHPDDVAFTLARWERAWRAGESYEIEYRFRRHDGVYQWFIGRANPIVDDTGAIVEWVGTCTDIDEQKRARHELSQFKLTLDQTLDCVFMFDPVTLRFFYVNQGASEQVGYSRDELLTMTPLAIKPEYDEPRFRAMVAPLIAGEKSLHTFETVHRHKDGHHVPVEIVLQYVAVPDAAGRFVAVVRDISDRLRAEEVLSQQRRLIDLAHEAIIVRDAQGNILSWNKGAEELYGWAGVDALGQKTHALLRTQFPSSESVTRVEEQDYTLSESGYWEGELIHTRRDGEQLIVESRQVAVNDAAGARMQILEINRDVTARRQAENELRASEQRYRALADAMPLQVWIAGPDGSGIYYSQRWLDYTGLTFEQAGEWAWVERIHEDDRPRCAKRWEICLKTGEPFEIEYRFRRHDGVYRWQLVRALALSGSNRRTAYWVGTNTDIDEQKQSEAALRQRSEQLAQATLLLEDRNRELDQFAYITSHDLKAPLRGIANLSQWIEEDLGEHVTPEAHQHLDRLRGRVHRMEALIDGILQYSRVGRVGGAASAVDTGLLLAEVIDLLAPPPQVTISIAPDMPTIFSERLLLQQVFSNLIGNAIKHHPGPKIAIAISARRVGGLVEFSVADNGAGIAPEYHERIFGIFQTLASRDRVEGSGLGLALVKKIVEHQRGRIRLVSDKGAGATFFFTWPDRAVAEEG